MKKEEREQHLNEVFRRLEQLDAEDREIIRPTTPNDPLTLTEAQLNAYGERAEERAVLMETLRVLAGKSIED